MSLDYNEKNITPKKADKKMSFELKYLKDMI